MGSHWFLKLLLVAVTAVSIEVDMERVFVSPHVLQLRFLKKFKRSLLFNGQL